MISSTKESFTYSDCLIWSIFRGLKRRKHVFFICFSSFESIYDSRGSSWAPTEDPDLHVGELFAILQRFKWEDEYQFPLCGRLIKRYICSLPPQSEADSQLPLQPQRRHQSGRKSDSAVPRGGRIPGGLCGGEGEEEEGGEGRRGGVGQRVRHSLYTSRE